MPPLTTGKTVGGVVDEMVLVGSEDVELVLLEEELAWSEEVGFTNGTKKTPPPPPEEGALTASVIAKDWGDPEALEPEMVAVALNVPEPRLVGVIMKKSEVVTFCAKEPLAGENESQFSVLVADQERVELDWLVLVMTTDSDEVAVEEALAKKEN